MVESRVATHQCFEAFNPHPDVEHKGKLTWVPDAEVLSIDGRDVFLGGCVKFWEGRGFLWSFPSRDIKKSDWIPVTRYLLARIEKANYRRLEASVALGFHNGYRLLFALGFEAEYVMQKYYPDGSDGLLFVRYGNG